MDDHDKTKQQLISENEELRRRIAALERMEIEGKWAEEALPESETRFRSLFRDSVTGMVVVAPNGELVQTNPAFCELLGYSEQELTGKTIHSITHPEDREGTSKVMRQGLISGPRLLRFETRYLHKNGQSLWGEVSSTLVCNAKGNPTYFIAQVLDIGERKRAEAALRKAHDELERRVEERTAELQKANEELDIFRKFAEASRQGFGMANMDGFFTYMNPAVCRMVGVAKPEDVIGKHLTACYPKGYMLRRETEIFPVLLQEGHWEGELVFSSAGKTMHVLQNSFLIKDENGNPSHIASVTTDITERKQTENRLTYLASFPERSPNPVIEAGLGGDIRYMNPTAYRLFPELREQGLKHPWFGNWEVAMRQFDEGRTETALHEVAVGDRWYQQSFYYAAQDQIVRIYSVDVTDRRVAREALQRSEERLRLAQQVARVGTFEWHVQTGLSIWTPELEAMYGLSPGEFPGTHRAWEKLVHCDDRANVIRLGEQALETGEPVEGEWRVVWPDGSVHWLAARCQAFKDEAGKPLRMVGVNIDITERKRAEVALRQNRDELRAIYDCMVDGLLMADIETQHFVQANASICRMLGYAEEELLSLSVQDIHPEADLPFVVQQFQALAEGNLSVSEEIPVLRKDGTVFYAVVSVSRVTHSGRRCVVGFFRDVTERKRTQEALRRSEERFRVAFEEAPMGMMIAVGDGIITRVNHALCSITGYTPEELTGSEMCELIHPEESERCVPLVQKLLAGKLPSVTLESRYLGKGGRVFWARATTAAAHVPDGEMVFALGIVEDITERKQAEEALRQKHAELQAIYDGMMDGLLIADAETKRFLRANPAICAMLGYSENDLLSLSVMDIHPQKDMPAVLQAFAEHVAGRHRIAENLPVLGKDGSVFYADIAANLLTYQDRPCLIGIFRDTTLRRNLENALRSHLETQSALALLLKSSLEPFSLEELWELTLDVLFSIPWIRLGPKVAIFLVEDDPQILVMKAQRGSAKSLLTPCDRVPFGCCLCGEAAEQRRAVFADCVDERHVTCYADMPPHGHYCIPIVSEDAVLGVISVYVEDGHERNPREENFLTAVADVLTGIVKRKRAEEALNKSEERFDLAVQGTDAGIWDWDLLTDQVYYSPRWKSMLGYKDHEIGSDFGEWEQRLHPDDRERALMCIQDYVQGRTPEYELEHRLQHKDGLYRWILARGAVVRDESGKPYRMVGSQLDITDRKRSEQLMLEREGELIAAQRIQDHLLPRSAPSVPGYDIAGSLQPADFAAGDYYDYLHMPDGSLGFAVGDVCGHGFSAALLMASISARLRSMVVEQSDIREILRKLNAVLCQEIEEDRFVTLLLVQIELASRRLKYVNLGHPSGYLLGQSGDVKDVFESGNPPLGVLPGIDLSISGQVEIEPNDIILLTTDGIVEARSLGGAMFGTERMLEVVRANRDRQASEIAQRLHQAVFDFTGLKKPQDDLTAVVIKVGAGSS